MFTRSSRPVDLSRPLSSSTNRCLLAALLSLGLAACEGDTPAELGDGGGLDGGAVDMGDFPMSCDVADIFEAKCGGGICHGPMNPAAGLDLISPGVDDRVSLVQAQQCPGVLADPSDPSGSVMFEKVAGVPNCGSRMPLGTPALSDEEISCVRDWISGLVPPPPPDLDMGMGEPEPEPGPEPSPEPEPEPEPEPTPDMGASCEPGTAEDCYDGPRATQGTGECVGGERICLEDGSGYGPCLGQVIPSVEDCRTPETDEDCDGVTPACSAVWSLAFGDDEAQSARSVVIDRQGNVFLAADFESTIDFGAGPFTSEGVKSDIVFAKYDPNGSPLFAYRFGDTSNQFATQLALGPDDSVFMIGRAFGTISFGGILHDGVGTDDVFVVKFANDGTFQWSTMVGGADPDRAERVAIDPQGDVLITGTFTGTADFGSGPFQSRGFRDAFVLKLDGRTGGHLFSRQYGGPGDDYGFGIAPAADGDILIAGRFEETAEFAPGQSLDSAGGRDIYLGRLDPRGDLRWVRRYGGVGEDVAYDLVVNPNTGDIVLHGAITGDVEFDGVPVAGAGSRDIFLAVFDADAELRWAAGYGDAADQYETDFDTNTWSAIALDADGNIHLTGPLAGTARFGDGPPLTSAGRTDLYIVKLDPDGRFLYGNRFGTDNTEVGLDVAVGPEGYVAIAGRVFGTRGINFGPAGRIRSFGSSDGFVLKILP